MVQKIKTVQIICEQCGQTVQKPKGRRFCNRSCANRWLHAHGKLNANAIIGMNMSLKSLISRYGEEEGKSRYDEFVLTMISATTGDKNPMFGRNDHCHGFLAINSRRRGKTDIEFYGLEKATEISRKKSAAVSGNRNPMYGKPSPKLSGKGVKGYYKGHYFRSILELVCMKYMENEGINLNDVKYEHFVIPYISYDGSERTYRPDFFVPERKLLIEAKPEKLSHTPLNSLKFEAARLFCKERNIEFTVFTERSSSMKKEDAVNDPQVIVLEMKRNGKE